MYQEVKLLKESVEINQKNKNVPRENNRLKANTISQPINKPSSKYEL